jgi:hypothetical protein
LPWGGLGSQTISDLVEAMTIVAYTGEVVTFQEETHGAETMNAVRCNLGAFGLIYQITLRVEPMFNLEVVDEHLPLSMVEDLPRLKALLSGNDEFFSGPQPPWASGTCRRPTAVLARVLRCRRPPPWLCAEDP